MAEIEVELLKSYSMDISTWTNIVDAQEGKLKIIIACMALYMLEDTHRGHNKVLKVLEIGLDKAYRKCSASERKVPKFISEVAEKLEKYVKTTAGGILVKSNDWQSRVDVRELQQIYDLTLRYDHKPKEDRIDEAHERK